MVWSSNTRGKSVSGLNLTEDHNLVLFGRNGETIWQSFDHPTDSLVLGQRLVSGQKLTGRVSHSNVGSGMYSVSIDDNRLVAYVETSPPQIYYASVLGNGLPYAEFINGSFGGLSIPTTTSSNDQFIRLGFDGLLKAYLFTNGSWTEGTDLFNEKLGVCGHPLVCGTYGICSNGYCHCPEDTTSANIHGSYFKQMNSEQPSSGCSMVTPLSCNHSRQHILLELKSTTYFAFEASFLTMALVKSVEDCKSMCLRNCSCKAALFVFDSTSRCLVLNEVFSVINREGSLAGYDTTLFLKVQNAAMKMKSKREKKAVVVAASSIASFLLFLSVILFWLVRRRRRVEKGKQFEVGFRDRVVGMPTAYSYQELKAMTDDFSYKLGEGGFGCVYEGVLKNGTKIAVKRLNSNSLGQSDDSFLAEVETIGSIHHANLVNLIGFCFQKSHRLLVYEHMANGSLDRWIFGKDESDSLSWEARRNIFLDVAKELAYLHEDCSQKIIHFDIKPQYILLDQNLNAKVADFGLSKLIDKDQSGIITRMRGTPGYLAPEWLSAAITEKVDVYSFSILILEIVCGRRNLDWCRDEEDRHLLELFKRKVAEEGEIQNLFDEKIKDFQSHVGEAEELMKIVGMCVLSDFNERPAMSLVVKVLESLMASETDLEYDFLHRPLVFRAVETADHVSLIMSSALSGPR